jgi:NADH-quinone oxidoreductase subunit C
MMNEELQSIVDDLQKRFSVEIQEFRGEIVLFLQPENVPAVCQVLRDEFDFELLTEETAVDYWPEQEPRFHVIYRLRSLKRNQIIGLRSPLNGNAPTMPSLCGIYANANWFERELWDMFGIRFDGHPDLRRLIMPADWVGHPLRKDYPSGYEEVEFSFNFDEIDLRKPYAQE